MSRPAEEIDCDGGEDTRAVHRGDAHLTRREMLRHRRIGRRCSARGSRTKTFSHSFEDRDAASRASRSPKISSARKRSAAAGERTRRRPARSRGSRSTWAPARGGTGSGPSGEAAKLPRRRGFGFSGAPPRPREACHSRRREEVVHGLPPTSPSRATSTRPASSSLGREEAAALRSQGRRSWRTCAPSPRHGSGRICCARRETRRTPASPCAAPARRWSGSGPCRLRETMAQRQQLAVHTGARRSVPRPAVDGVGKIERRRAFAG